MKVLLITDKMDIGGAETHILQLAKGLEALGAEVVIASGGSLRAKLRHVPLPLPSHNPITLLLVRRRIRRLCKRERFDIVHAHARIPALLIKGCRKYGAAELVTVHAHFRVNFMLSRICYWGEYTLAVSRDLADYLTRCYGVPTRQISVIPNGIDTRRFSPSEDRKKAADATVRILFASRLDRDCALGAELLCQIAPDLIKLAPQTELSIAGGGEAFSRVAELATQANAAIGRQAVRLLGHVADMSSLLQGQDIFVGVSRAAMEAASCGSAVILCGNEGYGGILSAHTAEVMQESNFCARGSAMPTANALQNDLCRLIFDTAYRETVAAEGRRWIAERCNAETTSCETLTLYERAKRSFPPKRVLVGGYFGCGNLGDDAILAGLLGEWKKQAPALRPTVLSGKPAATRRRFGVASFYRYDPFSFLFHLMRTDALLLGGGSLLQDLTSRRSLCYYLALLRVAALLRKPTMLCAAGIGPLVHPRSQEKAARTLATCRSIGLRDEGSKRLLTEFGIDPAKLHTSADPALLLPAPVCERGDELCIILKGGANGRITRRLLLAAARSVCRSVALTPHFLIFDTKHDRRATLECLRDLGGRLSQPKTPDEALQSLASCRAVLTMRLHGMILASLCGTPCVGVTPSDLDKKTEAFARATGQCCLRSKNLDVPTLTDAMQNALQKPFPDAILSASVEELQKKAQKDLANIAEMIYNIGTDL